VTEPDPIALAAVTKVYGSQVRALNDVSFTIASGERACLLGPNGAGKTTLIRLLTGALTPTEGAARIFGVSASEPGFLAAKRRVGIVPQAPGMYRDFKVGEYLQLVAELYGRGDVDAVTDAFGLSSYKERAMSELSGGYQRRLVLAAAVLPLPDLLLLDEPTVGLDPVAAREVHEYLRTMMAGRTTLLCTHNLAEAEALCDTVVILRQGRVLLHERIAELQQRTHPHVLLAAVQGPALLLQTLQQIGYTPQLEDGQVRISLAEPQQTVPDLLRTLLGSGLDVYESRVRRPSLEDVFLQVVGGHDDHA